MAPGVNGLFTISRQHGLCDDEVFLTARIADGKITAIECAATGSETCRASAEAMVSAVSGRRIEEIPSLQAGIFRHFEKNTDGLREGLLPWAALEDLLEKWGSGSIEPQASKKEPEEKTGEGPVSAAVEVPSDRFPTIILTDDTTRREAVIGALRTVFDPEIPIDIYELGLIYRVSFVDDRAFVEMSLTSPGCPVAGEMPGMVREAVLQVEGISAADVTLVWDPPWNPDMMSEDAKLYLGFE